ncbi:MAG: hypothetical protein ACRD40_06290 [Candidatus Acidiferrales bacterium]
MLSFAIAWIVSAAIVGCGTGTTNAPNGPANNPPPLSPVSVTITPTAATLLLGQTKEFQATVSGSTNEAVMWEVNGQAAGSTTLGEISSNGVYAAPEILPAPSSVTITAISVADSTASASATISIQDDLTLAISPSSINVAENEQQTFITTISSGGHPASEVIWSVDGIAGGNTTLGTIVASAADTAIYTAPAVIPFPPTVTVTATSVADDSKTVSASVTIICAARPAISPQSANVFLSSTQAFSASFCLAIGATIAWDVNGIPGGNAAYGTIVSVASTALYYASPDLPTNSLVTIHAVASAVTSGAASVSASVTIISNVRVTLSPQSGSVAAFQRITVTPSVSGTADGAVSWFVNGVPNGNASIGQICISGSAPCQSPAGPVAGAVDFFAPASVPAANPVTLTAVSAADTSRTGNAIITITGPSGPVSITVSPAYIFLPASSSQPDAQQFLATIAGTANTSVIWTVQSGAGCSGAACGTIDTTGLYTAPNTAPSPNAITITATSQADTSKSATATVIISSGPAIESILPSSVTAGAVEGFPLIVRGVNFAPGSGSAASLLLLNGVPRATTCSSAGQCAIALAPSDVTTAQTITIEVRNPGTPGALSNPVPFVIVPFATAAASISLTSSAPLANNTDVVVTDPTMAAASGAINIQSVGTYAAGGTCAVRGSPLTITRPASGAETVSICIYGNGLDPTFTYALTGPAAAPRGSDIGVTASAITGLFAGMIELDLHITTDTLPGVRTLFVTTLNNDRAIATGILEVK